jgi:hypothetical protein
MPLSVSATSAYRVLPRGLVNIPLEYFEAAIRWMRAQSWLRDHFLAVWGESARGELALLLVPIFPRSMLSSPGSDRRRFLGSWATPYQRHATASSMDVPREGAALSPGVQLESRCGAGGRARPAVAYTPFYLSHLRDKQAVERAVIPWRIRRARSSCLGSDDCMWPIVGTADIAFSSVGSEQAPVSYRHLEVRGRRPLDPRAIRSLDIPIVRSGRGWTRGYLCSVGGTPKADADASVDAWKSSARFLGGCRLTPLAGCQFLAGNNR